MRARAAGREAEKDFVRHAVEILKSDLENPEVRNRYELLKRRDPDGPKFAMGVSFSGNEANPLFHNTGEELVEIGTTLGASRREDGRGLAVLDLNQDGAMDLVVRNHYRNPVVAMINLAAGKNRWIRVRLRGTKSNRFGIGARVRAGGRSRELACGTGFLSGNAPELHFGMGEAATADVRIRWPSGIVEEYKGLATNQVYEFTEGDRSALRSAPLRRIGVDPQLGGRPPRTRLDVRSVLAGLRTLDGTPAPVQTGADSVIALFFSVNCHVCRGELERAAEIEEAAADRGARFVWVNIDANLQRARKGMELWGKSVTARRPAGPPGPIGVPTVYLLAGPTTEKFMGRHAVAAALEAAGRGK